MGLISFNGYTTSREPILENFHFAPWDCSFRTRVTVKQSWFYTLWLWTLVLIPLRVSLPKLPYNSQIRTSEASTIAWNHENSFWRAFVLSTFQLSFLPPSIFNSRFGSRWHILILHYMIRKHFVLTREIWEPKTYVMRVFMALCYSQFVCRLSLIVSNHQLKCSGNSYICCICKLSLHNTLSLLYKPPISLSFQYPLFL